MAKWIIGAVIAGLLSGYLFIPPAVVEQCDAIISVGLCLILFLVGVDMGRQLNVWQSIKSAGLKVLVIPLAVIIGTLAGGALAGLILPFSIKDTMAASAGLGWYSLAHILLADYSPAVSAVAFLSNVMREILAIILIPIVAKYLGFIETVALPGAAAMDTALPIVVKSTSDRITVYSFVSGAVLSFAVPVLVQTIIAL